MESTLPSMDSLKVCRQRFKINLLNDITIHFAYLERLRIEKQGWSLAENRKARCYLRRLIREHCCCFQVTSVLSTSVRPHRRQPTRLPHPWDSPGKNTGMGCHFLLQCRKVKSESEVAQSCPTRSDPMDCSLPGSSIQGIFQARVLEWVAIAFSEEYIISSLKRSILKTFSLLFGYEVHFQSVTFPY